MNNNITSRRRAKKELMKVLEDDTYINNRKEILTANEIFEYELYNILKNEERFDAYKDNLNDILRRNFNYGAFVDKIEVYDDINDEKEIGIGYNFANEYVRWIFYTKENKKLKVSRSFTIKLHKNGTSSAPSYPNFLDEKSFDEHMTKLTYKEVSRAYDKLTEKKDKRININIKSINSNLLLSNDLYNGIVVTDPLEKFIMVDKWYDDDKNVIRSYSQKNPSENLLDNDDKINNLFDRLKFSFYDLPEKIERSVEDSRNDSKAKELIKQKVRSI